MSCRRERRSARVWSRWRACAALSCGASSAAGRAPPGRTPGWPSQKPSRGGSTPGANESANVANVTLNSVKAEAVVRAPSCQNWTARRTNDGLHWSGILFAQAHRLGMSRLSTISGSCSGPTRRVMVVASPAEAAGVSEARARRACSSERDIVSPRRPTTRAVLANFADLAQKIASTSMYLCFLIVGTALLAPYLSPQV